MFWLKKPGFGRIKPSLRCPGISLKTPKFVAGDVLTFWHLSIFSHSKQCLELFRSLLWIIHRFQAYKCWNAVLNCSHWLGSLVACTQPLPPPPLDMTGQVINMYCEHDVVYIVYCLQYDTYKCISGLWDRYLPKFHSDDWADQMIMWKRWWTYREFSPDSAAPFSFTEFNCEFWLIV